MRQRSRRSYRNSRGLTPGFVGQVWIGYVKFRDERERGGSIVGVDAHELDAVQGKASGRARQEGLLLPAEAAPRCPEDQDGPVARDLNGEGLAIECLPGEPGRLDPHLTGRWHVSDILLESTAATRERSRKGITLLILAAVFSVLIAQIACGCSELV